jgi:hypothetical protein
MADSLFDNRYRYDYIYPRGRSGETLRAVDTHEQDREVVVKRPAPHDAPPIRNGQEVSIVNERKALQRLHGHPALAELCGGGQFSVSGVVHQYIVVERAQGVLIADLVRDLAQRRDRLPELEMLVIVDVLLDLLMAAHARDIVHNDVDAKHLFWDRDHYRLKVIDWGNAVFLEGDEVTPQGISRQSDIYQVGELLYYIVTGGGRADMPRDAGEDYLLDFGDDAARVSPRLQTIISRAAHANLRHRYRTLAELRKDLAEYRAPLQRERDTIVARVSERLQSDRSKDDLNALIHMLEPALVMDPGNPETRAVFAAIDERLSALEVAGDLDAARIYLESGNWARAAGLLDELRGRTRGETATQIKILREWSRMLDSASLHPTPLAFMDAIALVFEGDYAGSAHALLTQDSTDERVRELGWLMAERITAHVSDVVLLRPNLYRLEVVVAEMAADGQVNTAEARQLVGEIAAQLNVLMGGSAAKKPRKKGPNAAAAHLVSLRDGYRQVVDQLATLGTLLETGSASDMQSSHRLPSGLLERTSYAVMTLADNMHVIGRQAVSSPRDARAALEHSMAIDPGNPAWEMLQKLLDGLYELLQSYQTYIPAADGSDLAEWLAESARDLKPFSERLFDEMLAGMLAGLENAAQNWTVYADSAVMGAKIAAIAALTEMIDSISTLSPTLAGWLNQLRSVVQGAAYIERFALHGAFGRALADGWEHFDRGRLPEAERLAGQAFDAARREYEQDAARRLRELAEMVRTWVERAGVNDIQRCEAALNTIDSLFSPEEKSVFQQFNAQMPNRDVYLRAMGKGLIENFGRSSTASVRLLFFNFILRASLDTHDNSLDTASFWREAALRTLPDAGRHPLMRTLDEFTERRRDLIDAAALINSIHQPAQLASLEQTRRQLEENRQARLLTSAVYSLRELEAATRDWSDGEFRAAGNKLDNAVKAIDDVEAAGNITLTQYRAWLMTLINGAAELHASTRRLQSTVEAMPEPSDDGLRYTFRNLVNTTERLLGAPYASTLRQWRDTYEQFQDAFNDQTQRRSAKLNRFNDLFRALFIDRHPAYPLFRHWYSLLESAPEFPAPPTNEPTPYVTEDEAEPLRPLRTVASEEQSVASTMPRRGRLPLIIVGAVLALIVISVLILLSASPPDIAPTDPTASPETDAIVAAASVEPSSTAAPALTATPTLASLISTLPPRPTDTPTITLTPSVTPTATTTPTGIPTATATPSNTPLPPEGVRGVQNILALLPSLPAQSWTVEQFGRAEDGNAWRLGNGTAVGGDDIRIALPAQVLNTIYGNNAPARVISVEADLQLITYNPALLLENGIYFGLLLQDVENPTESAGLQINLVDLGVVNIGQVSGGSNSVITQRSLGAIRLRLRLDRNPDNGVVTTYVNGEPVGLPLTLRASQGILPMLYVRNGGVIVYAQSWTMALR